MNSLYSSSRKRIVALFLLFIFIILFGVTFATYLVNQYYREQLVENENERFIEYFEHDFQFTGEDSALNYAAHYSHINNLQIEITDENGAILYASAEPVVDYFTYNIVINDKAYEIKIDHTNSNVLIIRDKEILLIYYIVAPTYLITTLYIVLSRRRKNKKILSDIRQIEYLIEERKAKDKPFNYTELDNLYKTFYEYSSKLDIYQEKRKDGFNALAHDLKTPITILLSHLEGIKDSQDLIDNKDAIMQSLTDLSSTATDLVSGNFQGDNTKLNLSKELKKELVKYTSSFKSRNIELKSYILDGVYIKWNKNDFARVLGNLLTNAFYYSKPGTNVTVQLVNGNKSYSLIVINHGEQIEENNLEKIFDKNIRFSKNTEIQGNGIGLYITRLLVQEIGATIKAKSKDTLNTFTIEFPKLPKIEKTRD